MTQLKKQKEEKGGEASVGFGGAPHAIIYRVTEGELKKVQKGEKRRREKSSDFRNSVNCGLREALRSNRRKEKMTTLSKKSVLKEKRGKKKTTGGKKLENDRLVHGCLTRRQV